MHCDHSAMRKELFTALESNTDGFYGLNSFDGLALSSCYFKGLGTKVRQRHGGGYYLTD